MKNISFREPVFYLSTILFAIMTTLSVLNLRIEKLWIKLIIIIIAVAIFGIIQLLQSKKITEKVIKKMVENSLKTTDAYKNIVPDLRIRAGLFYLDRKKQYYYVKYQYNMINFTDHKIQIPLNLGCVGEAWRTGSQVFGDFDRIHAGGEFKIPDDQLKLIPADLTWVLATPIKSASGQVLGVVNIDGNKEIRIEESEKLREFSNQLVEELRAILYGLL